MSVKIYHKVSFLESDNWDQSTDKEKIKTSSSSKILELTAILCKHSLPRLDDTLNSTITI